MRVLDSPKLDTKVNLYRARTTFPSVLNSVIFLKIRNLTWQVSLSFKISLNKEVLLRTISLQVQHALENEAPFSFQECLYAFKCVVIFLSLVEHNIYFINLFYIYNITWGLPLILAHSCLLLLSKSKKTYVDGSCLILVSYKVAPVHESKLLFSFL